MAAAKRKYAVSDERCPRRIIAICWQDFAIHFEVERRVHDSRNEYERLFNVIDNPRSLVSTCGILQARYWLKDWSVRSTTWRRCVHILTGRLIRIHPVRILCQNPQDGWGTSATIHWESILFHAGRLLVYGFDTK